VCQGESLNKTRPGLGSLTDKAGVKMTWNDPEMLSPPNYDYWQFVYPVYFICVCSSPGFVGCYRTGDPEVGWNNSWEQWNATLSHCCSNVYIFHLSPYFFTWKRSFWNQAVCYRYPITGSSGHYSSIRNILLTVQEAHIAV